jgi:hypothetical protein
MSTCFVRVDPAAQSVGTPAFIEKRRLSSYHRYRRNTSKDAVISEIDRRFSRTFFQVTADDFYISKQNENSLSDPDIIAILFQSPRVNGEAKLFENALSHVGILFFVDTAGFDGRLARNFHFFS